MRKSARAFLWNILAAGQYVHAICVPRLTSLEESRAIHTDHVTIPLTDHRFESFVFNLARCRLLNTRARSCDQFTRVLALVSRCYLRLTICTLTKRVTIIFTIFSLALTPGLVVQFRCFLDCVNNSVSKIRISRRTQVRREKSFPDVIFYLLVYLSFGETHVVTIKDAIPVQITNHESPVGLRTC